MGGVSPPEDELLLDDELLDDEDEELLLEEDEELLDDDEELLELLLDDELLLEEGAGVLPDEPPPPPPQAATAATRADRARTVIPLRMRSPRGRKLQMHIYVPRTRANHRALFDTLAHLVANRSQKRPVDSLREAAGGAGSPLG